MHELCHLNFDRWNLCKSLRTKFFTVQQLITTHIKDKFHFNFYIGYKTEFVKAKANPKIKQIFSQRQKPIPNNMISLLFEKLQNYKKQVKYNRYSYSLFINVNFNFSDTAKSNLSIPSLKIFSEGISVSMPGMLPSSSVPVLLQNERSKYKLVLCLLHTHHKKKFGDAFPHISQYDFSKREIKLCSWFS